VISLVLYSITAFGFAYVVGHSVISRPAREIIAVWSETLITLIECPACLGFWTGLVFGLGLAFGPSAAIFPGPAWLIPSVLAFYTAGSNFILGRLTGLMQSPTAE
jgi:hypothetical protein